MKKIVRYSAIVAMVAAVSFACSKNKEIDPTPDPSSEELPVEASEEPVVVPGDYEYLFAIDGSTTKTTLTGEDGVSKIIAWESGDKVGWFAGSDKGESEVDVTVEPRTFSIKTSAALASGSKVYAFAPCKETAADVKAVALNIPAEQDVTGTFDGDWMPLVAVPVEIGSDVAAGVSTPVGKVQFLNAAALAEYRIYSSESAWQSETVKSVTFAADDAIAGDFTIDLTAVTASSVPELAGLSEKTIVTTLNAVVGESKESPLYVHQVLAAGAHTGTFTIVTDAAEYTGTVTSAVEFNRGQVHPLGLDLAGMTRTAKLTSPYSHTFVEGDFGISGETYTNPVSATFDGVTWEMNIVENNGGDKMYDWPTTGWYTPCIQVGYYDKGAPRKVTLSTENIPGAIQRVTLFYVAHDGRDDIVVSTTVGGDDFGSPVTHVDGATQAVFAGNAAGKIVITLTATDGLFAIFLKGIKVEFDPDGTVTPPEPGVEKTYDYMFQSGDFGFSSSSSTGAKFNDVLGGIPWTISSTHSSAKWYYWTSWAWAGNFVRGNTDNVSLTSEGFGGTISAISVDVSLGVEDGTNLPETYSITATVGDTSFGTKTATNADGNQQTISFDGSASGKLTITINRTQTDVAIMLRGIHVTYTPD